MYFTFTNIDTFTSWFLCHWFKVWPHPHTVHGALVPPTSVQSVAALADIVGHNSNGQQEVGVDQSASVNVWQWWAGISGWNCKNGWQFSSYYRIQCRSLIIIDMPLSIALPVRPVAYLGLCFKRGFLEKKEEVKRTNSLPPNTPH